MEQIIWHIAICEDDVTQQRNLHRIVNCWCESRGYFAKISMFATAEAFSHSIVLHFLKNKEHFYQEYKLDLKELEHQLLGQDFFRCHRS